MFPDRGGAAPYDHAMSPPAWCVEQWGNGETAEAAGRAAGDVERSLALAGVLARTTPALGGDSWAHLTVLATLGSVDLTTARAVEPHLDATGILGQAGVEPPGGALLAVWAAEGPGAALRAHPAGDGWVLVGDKPWCSLAGDVSHALVTAHLDTGGRGLFLVDLADGGVAVVPTPWVARGLQDVVTSSVSFREVPARAVGGPGWYLERAGFAWGGIGVAAVWFGGAASLAGALAEAARRRTPDQVALVHLGRCDRLLHDALLALRHGAVQMDAGAATGDAGRLLAARVRATVAAVAEEVMTSVGHALGPAPLAHDAQHAARVADLTLYLRQHHAERDLAALGSLLLATDPAGRG